MIHELEKYQFKDKEIDLSEEGIKKMSGELNESEKLEFLTKLFVDTNNKYFPANDIDFKRRMILQEYKVLNQIDIENVSKTMSNSFGPRIQDIKYDNAKEILNFLISEINTIYEQRIKDAKKNNDEKLSIIKERYLWDNNSKKIHERDRVILKGINKIEDQGYLYWGGTISDLVKLIYILKIEGHIDEQVLCFNEQGEAHYEKIQWQHIYNHFQLWNSNIQFIDKEQLKTEFNSIFHDENDIPFNITDQYHESYFIWLKTKKTFTFYCKKLAENQIIKSKLPNKKHANWASIVKHYMIITDDMLELLKRDEMNTIANSAKDLDYGEYEHIEDIIQNIHAKYLELQKKV